MVVRDRLLRRRLRLATQHAATAEQLVRRQREAITGLPPGAPSAAAGRRLLRVLEELHELTLTSQRQADTALRRWRR